MPVILATQEAKIRRITVLSQPRQIVHETLSQKKIHHKKRAGGVAQGVDTEFKSKYLKEKKERHPKCSAHRTQALSHFYFKTLPACTHFPLPKLLAFS
jgi:hypothetical protein